MLAAIGGSIPFLGLLGLLYLLSPAGEFGGTTGGDHTDRPGGYQTVLPSSSTKTSLMPSKSLTIRTNTPMHFVTTSYAKSSPVTTMSSISGSTRAYPSPSTHTSRTASHATSILTSSSPNLSTSHWTHGLSGRTASHPISRLASRSTSPETSHSTSRSKSHSTSHSTSRSTSRSTRAALTAQTMIEKPILCTLGFVMEKTTVGPDDGVCDYIIYDSLYHTGSGTFTNTSAKGLDVFMNIARTMTRKINARTEFGMSVFLGRTKEALNDLKSAAGAGAFETWWGLKIRHYAVLYIQAHYTNLRTGGHLKNLEEMFKHIRSLQISYGAGPVITPGYLFLGLLLWAPPGGISDSPLRELLRFSLTDGLIIQSHKGGRLPKDTICKITGPSNLFESYNPTEISMVDAWNYVQSNPSIFAGKRLAMSSTLAAYFFQPTNKTTDEDFKVGQPCISAWPTGIDYICRNIYDYLPSQIVPNLHVGFSFSKISGLSLFYETPDTLKYKVCNITKRYPTFKIGVALFDLNFEDTANMCVTGRRMRFAAGFWRAKPISAFVKTALRDPSFNQNYPICQ